MSLKAGRRGVRSKHVDIFGNLNESAIGELIEPIEEDIEDLDERLDSVESKTAITTYPASGLNVTVAPEGSEITSINASIKEVNGLVIANFRLVGTLKAGEYNITGFPTFVSDGYLIPLIRYSTVVNWGFLLANGTLRFSITSDGTNISNGLIYMRNV